MSDTNMEADMMELKKLQQRLNHESIRHQFRTKVVGGLNEEDVTKYIEDLEGKFKQLEQNYKKATDDIYIMRNRLNMEAEEKYRLEEKVKELKETTAKTEEERQSLSQLLAEADMKIVKINEYAAEFENDNKIMKERITILEAENNNVTVIQEENNKMAEEIEAFEGLLNQSSIELEHLSMLGEEYEKENTLMKAKIIDLENKLSAKDYKINEINRVCQDLKQELDIEKSCSEKLNMDLVIFKQKIISLEETISEKLEELDGEIRSREKVEQELAIEKSKVLSYRVSGFKEEFGEMYKKIEKLEEEAKESIQSAAFLQQQLAIQENRANKAESDLASFLRLLSGAKDKLYNERNLLGDQFTQLVETENWE